MHAHARTHLPLSCICTCTRTYTRTHPGSKAAVPYFLKKKLILQLLEIQFGQPGTPYPGGEGAWEQRAQQEAETRLLEGSNDRCQVRYRPMCRDYY